MKRVILLFLIVQPAFSESFFRVVTENWPPYSYLANGEAQGTATVLVRKILNQTGIPYSIDVYPWSRSYQLALNEPNVLIYSIMRIPYRENKFVWIGPLGDSSKVTFYRMKDSGPIVLNSLDDLMSLRVAVVRDAMTEHFLEYLGFVEDRHYFPVSTSAQCVLMMKTGRVDLVMFNPVTLADEIRPSGVGPGELVPIFTAFTTAPYLAASRSTPGKLIESLRSAYAVLVDKGQLERYE